MTPLRGTSPERAADPFPKERFLELVRRLPAYGRLAWRLARDPRLSRGRRTAVAGAAAYLVSPIDLVPGIIPVAGQLDDAAVALLGLRFALRGLPPAERQAHLEAAGLVAADLDRDLRTVRSGAAWLLRRGGRIGLWAGQRLVRAAANGARAAVERLR
ncbi:MAG TPA: YkvA family protein [Candidatus Limnocylindria bacterium]|nr:YkvA family protein [Candidatus Limnocylindria bacterium]